MSRTIIKARCTCGNITLIFESVKEVATLPVRACQCSFCRPRGVYTTSDPDGSIHISVADSDMLDRYRFGLGIAEYLICKRCGIYVGAVMTDKAAQFAIVNLAVADSSPLAGRKPEPVSYENETRAERIARRRKRWTPVTAWFEDRVPHAD